MVSAPGATLVIGIGNPDRGDDGAGCLVARRLAETGIDGVRILEHRAEASALLPYLAGAARAFLVDASVSGREPGTIHRFDVSKAPLPVSAQAPLSHGLGLGKAIELARALGELPGECVVFAIEAGQYKAGQALTPEVRAAVDRLTARLLADLSMRGDSRRRGCDQRQ